MSFESCSKKRTLEENVDQKSKPGIDDVCRKKFKPIAPKPTLKTDQHQAVVLAALPVKSSYLEDNDACNLKYGAAVDPGKQMILMSPPHMHVMSNLPVMLHPPTLVAMNSCNSMPVLANYSFVIPVGCGHCNCSKTTPQAAQVVCTNQPKHFCSHCHDEPCCKKDIDRSSCKSCESCCDKKFSQKSADVSESTHHSYSKKVKNVPILPLNASLPSNLKDILKLRPEKYKYSMLLNSPGTYNHFAEQTARQNNSFQLMNCSVQRNENQSRNVTTSCGFSPSKHSSQSLLNSKSCSLTEHVQTTQTNSCQLNSSTHSSSLVLPTTIQSSKRSSLPSHSSVVSSGSTCSISTKAPIHISSNRRSQSSNVEEQVKTAASNEHSVEKNSHREVDKRILNALDLSIEDSPDVPFSTNTSGVPDIHSSNSMQSSTASLSSVNHSLSPAVLTNTEIMSVQIEENVISENITTSKEKTTQKGKKASPSIAFLSASSRNVPTIPIQQQGAKTLQQQKTSAAISGPSFTTALSSVNSSISNMQNTNTRMPISLSRSNSNFNFTPPRLHHKDFQSPPAVRRQFDSMPVRTTSMMSKENGAPKKSPEPNRTGCIPSHPSQTSNSSIQQAYNMSSSVNRMVTSRGHIPVSNSLVHVTSTIVSNVTSRTDSCREQRPLATNTSTSMVTSQSRMAERLSIGVARPTDVSLQSRPQNSIPSALPTQLECPTTLGSSKNRSFQNKNRSDETNNMIIGVPPVQQVVRSQQSISNQTVAQGLSHQNVSCQRSNVLQNEQRPRECLSEHQRTQEKSSSSSSATTPTREWPQGSHTSISTNSCNRGNPLPMPHNISRTDLSWINFPRQHNRLHHEQPVSNSSSTCQQSEQQINTMSKPSTVFSDTRTSSAINSEARRSSAVTSDETRLSSVVNSDVRMPLSISSESPRLSAVNSRRPSAHSHSDVTRQLPINSDATRSSIINSDTRRPSVNHADAIRQLSINSDATRSSAVNSHARRSSASNSEATRQLAINSGTTRSSIVNSDATMPSASHSNAIRPLTINSDVTRSSAVNSDERRSSGSHSNATMQSAVNAEATRPSNINPDTRRQPAVNSDVVRLSVVNTDERRLSAVTNDGTQRSVVSSDTRRPSVSNSDTRRLSAGNNETNPSGIKSNATRLTAVSSNANRPSPITSDAIQAHPSDSSTVQTVPLISNLPASSRLPLNSTVSRKPRQRCSLSRQESNSSSTDSTLRHQSDPVEHSQHTITSCSASSSHKTCTRDTEATMSSLIPSGMNKRLSHNLSIHTYSQNKEKRTSQSDHTVSDLVFPHQTHSPASRPMLYNFPHMLNSQSDIQHRFPVPGSLGRHSLPSHHMNHHQECNLSTPSHSTPHMHQPNSRHLLVPPPPPAFGSMHRSMFMSPSPHPTDLNLMSPRSFPSTHMHDNLLYSPASIPRLPTPGFPERLHTSYPVHYLPEERIDSCCSGGLRTSHSPTTNSFSSPWLLPSPSRTPAPPFLPSFPRHNSLNNLSSSSQDSYGFGSSLTMNNILPQHHMPGCLSDMTNNHHSEPLHIQTDIQADRDATGSSQLSPIVTPPPAAETLTRPQLRSTSSEPALMLPLMNRAPENIENHSARRNLANPVNQHLPGQLSHPLMRNSSSENSSQVPPTRRTSSEQCMRQPPITNLTLNQQSSTNVEKNNRPAIPSSSASMTVNTPSSVGRRSVQKTSVQNASVQQQMPSVLQQPSSFQQQPNTSVSKPANRSTSISEASQIMPPSPATQKTSNKYLPIDEVSSNPSTSQAPSVAPSPTQSLTEQPVKFNGVTLQCSRQILCESGRTVLCCWNCDFHTAEPKKMHRHQRREEKIMRCQLCSFTGNSRCKVDQHFKENHLDKDDPFSSAVS